MSFIFEPKKEYTPMPFWFWNDDLSEAEIKRQMEEMKDKGIDGFVIHPRLGLTENIGYLTDTYFHFVQYAVKLASVMDMKVILYDEAMYPSGSAHGMVVKTNPDFASKGLKLVSKEPLEVQVVLSEGTIRGVFPREDDGQELAPKAADLLNPGAVDLFIKLTHECYYEHLSEYFGNTIIAFFTDEPNILGRNNIPGIIPWTDDLMNDYLAAGGLKENLYLLFEKETSPTKDIYEQVIYKRMRTNYYGKLSKWCEEHSIALMGHPEKSTDIGYLSQFHIPCQDIVWRFIAPENEKYIIGADSTMGKCSSDSARHRGRSRNGNECFGVCSLPETPFVFTEQDMLWYLNWLFVRNVNFIIPHAFYYSIRGERGNERPPEVGLNNPFWPQYKKLSNYIKRMSELNTDAVNDAKIAILCTHNELSDTVARPLFEHQIEFNYLEEELLEQCYASSEGLHIKNQCYRYVIVPNNIPQSDVLDKFVSLGGKLISYNSDEQLLTEVPYTALQWMNFRGDIKNLRATYLEKLNQKYIIISNDGIEPISFTGEGNVIIDAVVDMYNEIEQPVGSSSVTITLNPSETRVIYIHD